MSSLLKPLSQEKQAFLLGDLSKQYETGQGYRTDIKEPEDNMSSSKNEDVNSKTAKKVNVSAKTVQRARSYVKAVKKNPKKYKGGEIRLVFRQTNLPNRYSSSTLR